jgi:TolA-binding protein
VYQILTMNTFSSALLVSSIAFAINTYAQNAMDNPSSSNNSNASQAPTIEDRLAQLEQDQQGLTERVDALGKQLASLEQELKTLEGQSSGSNGNSSRAPAGQVNETAGAANGSPQ